MWFGFAASGYGLIALGCVWSLLPFGCFAGVVVFFAFLLFVVLLCSSCSRFSSMSFSVCPPSTSRFYLYLFFNILTLLPLFRLHLFFFVVCSFFSFRSRCIVFFVFLSSSTARVSSLCPCRHAEGLNMWPIHLKLSCRTAHCAGQFTLLSAPCANSSLFPFGYSWVPFLYWPFLLPCMSCSGSLGLTCCKLVECFLDILVLLSLHMNTFHDVIWSHLGWLDITPRATGFQLIVCYFAVSSTA